MKDNKKYIKESELFDDDNIITEGEDNEENNNADNLESEVSDEMIRIDSLKLANKICRMIDSVSVEDLINVSSMAEKFLRDYIPGCDIEEILGLKSSSTDNKKDEETPSENEENSSEDSEEDINIDDLDDFTIEDDEEDEKKETEDEEEDKDDNTNETSSEVPDQFII